MPAERDPSSVRRRAIPLLAVVASVVAVGLAIYCRWARLAAESELAARRTATETAATRLRAVQQLAQTDLQEAAGLQAVVARLEHPPAPPAARFPDGFAAGRAFMQAHPEAQTLIDAARRDLANSWPKTAGRRAGFSEEQIERYADLFRRQKMSPPFIVDGVRLPPNGDLEGDVQGELLKELVGPELFARYEAYMADGSAHMYTGEVAQAASSRDTPLTTAQTAALLRVFTDTKKPVDWTIVTAQAAAILSPAQMSALTAVQTTRTSLEELNASRRALLKSLDPSEP